MTAAGTAAREGGEAPADGGAAGGASGVPASVGDRGAGAPGGPPSAGPPTGPPRRTGLAAALGSAGASLERVEEVALVAALALATVVPLVDAFGRPLGGFHIPGSALYVQQLTLWLAFVGGLAATRRGTHLTLSTAQLFAAGSVARRAARLLAFAAAAAVVAVLAYASAMLVASNRQQGNVLPGGLPEWVSECVMPVALGLMALRFAWGAGEGWRSRAVAVAAIGLAFGIGLVPAHAGALVWPLALVVVGAALLGAPVFVAMGGLALVLFFSDGTPVAAVSAEVYRLIASPTLPAIPLLTAAGYVLERAAPPRAWCASSARCSAACRAAWR